MNHSGTPTYRIAAVDDRDARLPVARSLKPAGAPEPVLRCLTDGGRLRSLSSMSHMDRISIEPGTRSGNPCIRGLRITVSDALDYLASGRSEEDVLRDFPDLTTEDIRACLAFAADRER